MKNQSNGSIWYEFYAQNRGGLVILKNLKQNNYFIRRASELVSEQEILAKLPQEHRELIRAIAKDEQG